MTYAQFFFVIVEIALIFFNFQFHCCGVDDYMDFFTAKQWDRRRFSNNGINVTLMTPLMCCKNKTSDGNDTQSLNYTECATNPTMENSNFKHVS